MHDLLPDWTETPEAERAAKVSALAKDGKPASFIARSFRNCTRNIIIGYCSRRKIQLKGRAPKPPAPPKKPKPKVEARISVREIAIARADGPRLEADPDGLLELGNDVTGLIGIMDLKVDSCRYMYGDPKGQHGYCGKTAKGNSSWCPHHHDIVFGGRP